MSPALNLESGSSVFFPKIFENNPEKEMYNLSMEDIFGFCNLLKTIVKYNPNNTVVYIDRDMSYSQQPMDKEMLKAGGIITYAAGKLGINYVHSSCGFINEQDKQFMIQFAENYETTEKNKDEEYLFRLFISDLEQNKNAVITNSQTTDRKFSLLQHICSVCNMANHKVVRILGLKIKIRMKRKGI